MGLFTEKPDQSVLYLEYTFYIIETDDIVGLCKDIKEYFYGPRPPMVTVDMTPAECSKTLGDFINYGNQNITVDQLIEYCIGHQINYKEVEGITV